MAASVFIGRVGGLAVALGIGLGAVGAVPAVSWASPESPAGEAGPAGDKAAAQRSSAASRSGATGRAAEASPRRSTASDQSVPTRSANRSAGNAESQVAQVKSRVPSARAEQQEAPSFGDLVQYTLFHRAPTASPAQDPGQSPTGVVTGNINADSASGGPLSYAVAQAPARGTVQVTQDGAYTYTPDAGLAQAGGTDEFSVTVDNGSAFRLTGIAGLVQGLIATFAQLVGLRQPDTLTVAVPVSIVATGPIDPPPPGNLAFSFDYNDGSEYWSDASRADLQWAADTLASYLVVDSPVTITFSITGIDDPEASALASAGSDLTNGRVGFYDTVVQNKVLTGADTNGSAADGEIDANFGVEWAFGDSVGPDQYDFRSTMLHELLHAFGFLSYIDAPGKNSGRNWVEFDRFVVDQDGTAVIGTDFRFKNVYEQNLIGGAGGLYFGGSNAVDAYGGLVPLYTPDPWEDGSSGSHLDDVTFVDADQKLMNAATDTGPGVRVIDAVELGILKDIGYTVNPQPSAALLFLGMLFVRRKRS